MFNKKLLFSIVSFLPLVAFAETYKSVKNSMYEPFYVKMGGSMMFDVDESIANAYPAKIREFNGNMDYFRGRVEVNRSSIYKPTHKKNRVYTHFGIGKHLDENSSLEFDFSLDNLVAVDSLSKNKYFNNITGDAAFSNLGFNVSVATLNYVYDGDTSFSYVSPYVSAGFGVSRVEFISSAATHTFSYPLAIQLRAGIKFDYNKSMPFYFGYKMISLLKSESYGNIISTMPTNAVGFVGRLEQDGCTPVPSTSTPVLPDNKIPTIPSLKPTEPIASLLTAKYMLHSFELGINLDLS